MIFVFEIRGSKKAFFDFEKIEILKSVIFSKNEIIFICSHKIKIGGDVKCNFWYCQNQIKINKLYK